MVKIFGHFFSFIFIGLYKPAGYMYLNLYHPLSYPLRFCNMYSYKRAQKTIFIGSAISEILRYRQTHKHTQTSCYFYIKGYKILIINNYVVPLSIFLNLHFKNVLANSDLFKIRFCWAKNYLKRLYTYIISFFRVDNLKS